MCAALRTIQSEARVQLAPFSLFSAPGCHQGRPSSRSTYVPVAARGAQVGISRSQPGRHGEVVEVKTLLPFSRGGRSGLSLLATPAWRTRAERDRLTVVVE